jgi:hypothetical protein
MLSIPGIAYSLHFCGEKLSSYSYKVAEKKSCACKQAKTQEEVPAKDCCDDQQVSLSTENSKVSTFDYKLGTHAYSLLSTFFIDFFFKFLDNEIAVFPTDASHLSSLKVPIYLLNRHFRI